MKVYSPTTVISLRGTSFEVNVNPETKATVVKVINGTVNIQNIKNHNSTYLSAPYKVTSDKKSDKFTQAALLSADIDSLKTWVAPELIESEITNHLAKAHRDHLILTGKATGKCLLVPFINNSSYKMNWKIEKEIPQILNQKLQKLTNNFTVFFIDSSPNFLEIAKNNNARFLVTGSIDAFEIKKHAQISAKADEYRELSIARVHLTLKLTDVKSEKIILEETFSGEVSGKNDIKNSWDSLKKLPFDLTDPSFCSSIIAQSLLQALDHSCEKILKSMTM